MSPDVIAAGVFGIVGAVLGVVVGLLGERWVRKWGDVQCDIDWRPVRGAGSVDSPGGVEVQERWLRTTFLNRKDVPVTVWDIRVTFYKGGRSLIYEERPNVQFVDAGAPGGRSPVDLVNLPPHIAVTRTVSITPGHNETARQRAVEAADQVEFEATMIGARNISMALAHWNEQAPQTERYRQSRWRRVLGS